MRFAIPLLILLLSGCASPETAPVAAPGAANQTAPPPVVTFQNNTTLAQSPLAAPIAIHPTGAQGGEPSIGVTPKGSLFVVAYEQTLRSADQGKTWASALDYSKHDPTGTGALGSNDPYLHVDRRTGRVFTDHMQLTTCTTLLWSDDEGASWTSREQACGSPVVDFPKVISAKPGPKAPPLAGVAYPDVVFVCYNKGSFGAAASVYSTTCAASYDGGLTFPIEREALAYAYVPQAKQFVGSCAGGATFADAPDGTLVAVACGGYGVARTRDSGLTWETLAPPKDSATMGGSVPFASFGDDGTLYLMTVGNDDGRAYLHRSLDAGVTWSEGFAVSPPGVGPVSFPSLVAGAKGRVAMAFLMARENATDPEKVSPEARWSLWLATIDDALSPAPAVRAMQATPDADPVQVGPICLGGASCRDARNLADFIGSARGPDGAYFVVFADGCVDACAASPSAKASRSAMTTVAALEGWSLSPGSGTP